MGTRSDPLELGAERIGPASRWSVRSTSSTTASAARAFSTSRRPANCCIRSLRRFARPLSATSSSARRLDVGVPPVRTRSTERRMPNRPKRSSRSSALDRGEPTDARRHRVLVHEVVDRHQQALEVVGTEPGQQPERMELVLAEGDAGLRDQARNGHHGLADATQPRIARCTGWRPSRPTPSRPLDRRPPRRREHRDDAGRGRVVAVSERVEEAKVRRVEVAVRYTIAVGGAVIRLAGERSLGACRELGRDRGEPRRVDEAHRSKSGGRPLDHDALEGLGRELPE